MKIKRYKLPRQWDEETFDDSKCFDCKLDLKVESIKAMKNRSSFYVYEIVFQNRQRFFLCKDCFNKLIRESVKLLL